MKKIIFSVICIALVLLSLYFLKFTGGWFAWYLLALPLIVRIVLKTIYRKFFPLNQNINKVFNIATLAAYLLVIAIIVYAIVTVDMGNSWI